MRAALYAIALLLLSFVQRRVIEAALASETYHSARYSFARWTFHALPIDVLSAVFQPSQRDHALFVLVAAAESAVLFLLARELRARPPGRPAVAVFAVVFAAMAVSALLSKSMLSSDVYAYVGYAKFGMQGAYAPPDVPFKGDFATIDALEGRPLPVCSYGPVWLAIAHLIAGGAGGIVAGIAAFRLLGLAALAAIVLLFYKRGLSAAALAVVSLDPSIFAIYISDAHNDLVAMAFVVAATVAARRRPALAAVLVATGALVKLPVIALALVVFSNVVSGGSLRRRAGFVALAIVLLVAGSFAIGGPDYVLDLVRRLNYPNGEGADGAHVATATLLRRGLTALAGIALLLAFFKSRFFSGASAALSALSTLPIYPWYLVDGLTYAAYGEGAFVRFCVAFPLLAALFDSTFPAVGTRQIAMFLVLIYAGYTLFREARTVTWRRRPTEV